jgi:hypothetical protein
MLPLQQQPFLLDGVYCETKCIDESNKHRFAQSGKNNASGEYDPELDLGAFWDEFPLMADAEHMYHFLLVSISFYYVLRVAILKLSIYLPNINVLYGQLAV